MAVLCCVAHSGVRDLGVLLQGWLSRSVYLSMRLGVLKHGFV